MGNGGIAFMMVFGGKVGTITLLKLQDFKNLKKKILTLRINMILFIMNQ